MKQPPRKKPIQEPPADLVRVRAGLQRLGFEIPAREAARPSMDDATRKALRAFQRQHALKTTGEPTADTVEAIDRAAAAADEPSARVPPPIESVARTIADTAGVSLPRKLRTVLSEKGFDTLADIQRGGGLASLGRLAPAEAQAAALLEAHADLLYISPDVTSNAALIKQGFSSVQAVADTPPAEFVSKAFRSLGDAGAASVHAAARAHVTVLDNVIAGLLVDRHSPAAIDDPMHLAIAEARQPCECDNCKAAMGPAAYLADLIGYVVTHLRVKSATVDLNFLTNTFLQPFGDLATDCKSVERQVRQVRIMCEVLRRYLKVKPPTATQQAALDAVEASYRLAAYRALLELSGGSYDAVRLARHASHADRVAFAGRIGIDVDPDRLPRPDRLDALFLDPSAAVGTPGAISDATLERLFGLVDTTMARHPLSDGFSTNDTPGQVARWTLDGVDWGWNTDVDGQIHLSIAKAGTVYTIDLYRDAARTSLVASGSSSDPNGTVLVTEENHSGLSGTFFMHYSADASDVALGAIPALLAWRLEHLRPMWSSQDRPIDAYTAGASASPLAVLPAGLVFPPSVAARTRYEPVSGMLLFSGVMSPQDRATLLGLSADASYQTAVNDLYWSSDRPAVVDADVIGPDDFRVPFAKAAAGDPDGPFDLWLKRRDWIDTQLQTLAAITRVVGGATVPDVEGMLAAMYSPVTYDTVTITPWDATTPQTMLDALRENVSSGADTAAVRLRIQSDLGMTLDSFSRLIDLRLKDRAASVDARNSPVMPAEWREVFSILVQVSKRRLASAWRDEEDAAGVQLGPRDFYNPAREPIVGDWPPLADATRPLIDPEAQRIKDLPEPVVGERAIAFWNARRAELDAARDNLRTTRQTLGLDAMLHEALGSPKRGDALPFNLDTLLANLNSTVPAVRDTATANVTNGLRLTVEDFRRLMLIRAKNASADPLKKPTAAEWADILIPLTTADKALHLFAKWITEEQAAATGVTYWTARKAAVPMWRAGAGARSAWLNALSNRERPPVLDPDVVGVTDLKAPFAGERAFDLWNVRRTWIDGRAAAIATTLASGATLLAGFDDAVEGSIGVTGTSLAEVGSARLAGEDVSPRLRQLSLSLDAVDVLLRFRQLAQSGVPVLASEQDDVAAILTRVEKVRKFPTWRDEEAALPGGPVEGLGLALGPDDFHIPEPPKDPFAPAPATPQWLTDFADRDAWQDTLRTRIDQHNALVAAMHQTVDAAEEATLPALRDGLVAATDAPGLDLEANAKWVTTRFQVDASMGGCHKTTRVEQALETLQGVVQAVRNGQMNAWPAGEFWLDAPDFEREWKWMGLYAPWRAAMLVWMYPDGILLPGLRKWQSAAFARLVDNLRWNTALTMQTACAEAAAYAEYFHDVCTLTVEASVQTNTHVYQKVEGGCPIDIGQRSLLYMFGSTERSKKAYWSVFDPADGGGYAQTFWEPIPTIGPVSQILGAARYQQYIYVFATEWNRGTILKYVRYDCEARQWAGDAIRLDFPKPPATSPAIVVKQAQSENYPPHLLLQVDGTLYEKRLSFDGLGWADTNWIPFFLDRWSDTNVPAASRDYSRDAAVDLRGPYYPVGMVGITGDPDIFFVFVVDKEGYLWVFYRRTTVSATVLIHGGAPSQYAWQRLDKAEYLGSFFWPGTFQAYLATSTTPLWLLWEEDDPGSPIGVIGALAVGPFIAGLKMVVPNSGSVSTGSNAQRLHPLTLNDGAYRATLRRVGNGVREQFGHTRILPSVSGPFEIVQAGSATEQQTRAVKLQAAYAANAGSQPAIMAYLEEAFRLVPTQIALSLQSAGAFEAALAWFRTVYDYTLPIASRKIDYGLVLEESYSTVLVRLDDWLFDPLNPHLIAATRRNAYTRFAILSEVRCLYDYADAEFARDTPEQNAHARLLYSIALDLLDLAVFAQAMNPCEGLWIKLGQDIIIEWPWGSLWDKLGDRLKMIAEVSLLEKTVGQLKEIMTGPGSTPERLEKAMALVNRARAASGPAPTMRQVLGRRSGFTAAAHQKLLADPTVAEAAEIARRNAGREMAERLEYLSVGDPAAPKSRRVDLSVLREPVVVSHQDPAPAQVMSGSFTTLAKTSVRDIVDTIARVPVSIIRAPADWFCVPPNPLLDALRRHGTMNLFKLRHCMNIAGMQRELEPYSAPTDLTGGLPTIGPGGQLIVPGAPSSRGGAGLRPTPYRPSVLMDRAKQLALMAAQAEDRLLSITEKRDAELYNLIKARQDVRVAQATVQLQDLRIQEAESGVMLAQLQQERARIQVDHWRDMLSRPISALEQKNLDLLTAEANVQMAAYAANSAAAAAAVVSISDVLSSGSDAMAKAGQALTSLAAVYQTQAGRFAAQASYERRQEEWQFQQALAVQDSRIGQQSVAVAEAHARVAGQERVIAQIQADHAAAMVDFLSGKFTSVNLYDWMSGVLERVYRFFLDQATAMALLAQDQLAFQRQEVPPAFIQSDYWSAPSSGSSTSPDRKGLTGSARLQQDIYQLDQYAFQTDKRKLQLSKTISLMQLDPYEFQRFRETGVLRFATPMELFDRDFPGHYLRLIRRVRTTVIALVPPTQGIRATLSNTGTSRVVIGGDMFQRLTVRRDPEIVALSAAANATGLFEMDVQPEMLLPFEGLGVDGQWEFRLPKPANPFDFKTVADVLFTIDYTALSSFEYQQEVLQRLTRRVSANRAFSFRQELADAWYDLHNPDQTSTPMTVTFSTAASDFPPNLEDVRIQHVTLYFSRADGVDFELAPALSFAESGATVLAGGSAVSIDGMINTRRGNGSAWMSMIGRPPVGTWTLTLPNTFDTRRRFVTEAGGVGDILLVVTYSGRTPSWPETGLR